MADYYNTCKGKGGVYELLGTAKGSGPLHGQQLQVYRDVNDGQIYYRSLDDWEARMERAVFVGHPSQMPPLRCPCCPADMNGCSGGDDGSSVHEHCVKK